MTILLLEYVKIVIVRLCTEGEYRRATSRL